MIKYSKKTKVIHMIFSKKTSNKKELTKIDSFLNEMKSLLQKDIYISKSDYMNYIDQFRKDYEDINTLREKQVLSSWCKKNKIKTKTVDEFIEVFEQIDVIVKKHNEDFINYHLKSDQEYLDSILKDDDPSIMLDQEQRKAILSDEDYTLIIAGAGAGKTTTIEAKVKYLIDKLKVSPNEILVVSYTKKATNELKERFEKIGLNPNILTFHSIGNLIIKENEKVKHRIVQNTLLYDTIYQYLTTKLEDENFIKKVVLFFASYLNVPFDENNISLLYKVLREDNITTLKSDLENEINQYEQNQTKQKITINNEKVRSIDECRIANYLYIHNIEYEYEPVYPYGFNDSTKPYCPDFLLKQNGKVYYLEHFGISESGINNRFTEDELEEYKKHINDKIKLHRLHNTTLIYTFSKYNDGKDLIEHLKAELIHHGIELSTVSNVSIYKKIIQKAENKYFNQLTTLICNFIHKFKVNNFPISKFDEWKIQLHDERTKLFLDICYQVFLTYEKMLKETNSIDFEDMINRSIDILNQRIQENDLLPYQYIFIDEYQDISMQRFDLCEKLSKISHAKIIAVGDDWQSIYRFNGAKISLFTKFEDAMGYANILRITNTYRNSQELIDIAGEFVMQNEKQIQKKLNSNKRMQNPIVLTSYNDLYDYNQNESIYNRFLKTIERSLDHIVANYGEEKNVLFIGRYRFEQKNLLKQTEMFTCKGNHILSKKYPRLKIDFLTAHSSKGLTYDNVVIINAQDNLFGFPSKIEDDPIMKLVIKDEKEIEYAEERRLFYVALTRTRNQVYIVTPQFRPSPFILELIKNFKNVVIDGPKINESEKNDFRLKCPVCGYPLQRRKSKIKLIKDFNTLWICSNDPEVCGFMTNDLMGGKMSISKCTECEDGYLVVKTIKDKNNCDTGTRILGCTNYKRDGTGCNAYLMLSNYTQDRSKLSILFYNENMSIEKMIFMDYPIKELVYKIIYILKNIKDNIPNFDFSFGTFRNFLLGVDDKIITSFNLKGYKGFALINQKYSRKLNAFLMELEKNEIIKINKEKFNSISILNHQPSDEKIKVLFSNLVH